MKDLPFNVSILVFALYLGVMIAGGIATAVLKNLGLYGFWHYFLAILIALPVGNAIRYGLGQVFAEQSGHSGPQPKAFNFPTRMAIGAVVAIPVAALISSVVRENAFHGLETLWGAIAALITTAIIACIFYLSYSRKE
ncbi:hypothetical protein ACS3SW_07535 [Roseobacteraceae bacterium S113]